MEIEQRLHKAEQELLTAGARIAMLEAALAGLLQRVADPVAMKDFIARLEVIRIELIDQGFLAGKNNLLENLKNGPSPDGPNVKMNP